MTPRCAAITSSALAICLILFSARIFGADQPFEFGGKVPEFAFTDQNERRFGSQELIGKVWIGSFIFTRCQSECLLISGRMLQIQEELLASGVRMVSFSVDPVHDTPQVLREYAKRFHAQPGKWFFLTGKRDAIWKLMSEGFQLGVTEATEQDLAQGAQPIIHSDRLVLVDRQGKIRGYYSGSEMGKVKELIQTALELDREGKAPV